jgi:formate-dependent nitrite reductase cytochrome c552 subunit
MALTDFEIRGLTPEAFGMQDSPELRDLLEAIDREAFDAGREAGEEAVMDQAQADLDDRLTEIRKHLDRIARDLTDAAASYAIAHGAHLHAPDDHENTLLALCDELEALFD